MSIRLALEGTIKDGVTREAFIDMARRATAFSEEDRGVVTHKSYLSDEGRYFEEAAFTGEAGFFAHVGPATEAGIMDAYLGAVDLETRPRARPGQRRDEDGVGGLERPAPRAGGRVLVP